MIDEDLWRQAAPETERRLLNAAVATFARRGYHATTTREIASAAGMSPAALYVYFSTKAEVLATISIAGHRNSLLVLRNAVALPVTNAAERLRTAFDAYVGWHLENGLLARVIQDELRSLDAETWPTIRELRRETRQVVREVLQQGTEEGIFEIGDVETTLECLFAIAIFGRRPRDAVSRADQETVASGYSELALRLVTTPGQRLGEVME